VTPLAGASLYSASMIKPMSEPLSEPLSEPMSEPLSKTLLSRLAGKDPVSAWTHIAGFIAGIIGLVYLVERSQTVSATASLAVYGASLVAIFLASSAYHFFDLGPRGNRVLRRLDHSAIYLFIAGTYVPIVTHAMDGTSRVVALSVVSGLALAGIIFKLTVFNAPRWVNASLYVALGWAVVPFAPYMLPQLDDAQLTWLLVGGVAYTMGAIVYALKRPDPWPEVFGFHEIWHLFVLVAAGAHFGLVRSLLVAPPPPF
jgi:hemolysin III